MSCRSINILMKKLNSNVQLNKVMCRTHVTFVPALSRKLFGVWIAFSDSFSFKMIYLSGKLPEVHVALLQVSVQQILYWLSVRLLGQVFLLHIYTDCTRSLYRLMPSLQVSDFDWNRSCPFILQPISVYKGCYYGIYLIILLV